MVPLIHMVWHCYPLMIPTRLLYGRFRLLLYLNKLVTLLFPISTLSKNTYCTGQRHGAPSLGYGLPLFPNNSTSQVFSLLHFFMTLLFVSFLSRPSRDTCYWDRRHSLPLPECEWPSCYDMTTSYVDSNLYFFMQCLCVSFLSRLFKDYLLVRQNFHHFKISIYFSYAFK